MIYGQKSSVARCDYGTRNVLDYVEFDMEVIVFFGMAFLVVAIFVLWLLDIREDR